MLHGTGDAWITFSRESSASADPTPRIAVIGRCSAGPAARLATASAKVQDALDLDARELRMRLPAGLTTINAPMTEEERAAQRQASQKDEADDAL